MDYTAEDLMRDMWNYLSVARGEEITINRNYLYQKVIYLQRDSYERGYSRGYKHGLEAGREPNAANPMDNPMVYWQNTEE